VGIAPHNALACASGFDHVVISEVRSLAELNERIEEARNLVAFVEVTRTNLDALLSWLAAQSHGSGCAVVAGLDHDLKTTIVTTALREAGAMDIADSPRRLQSAIRVALSQTAAVHRSKPLKPAIGQSLQAWARSLLPWQAAR
jgi:hypothetical protein